MSTLQLYRKFGANIFGGEVSGDVGMTDYLTNAIRATLHTNTYVPNVATDEAFADATNELTTANGYTANGIAIAGKTIVYTAPQPGGWVFDMNDTTVTWTASGAGLTFRYVVFHDDTVSTGPPVKPLYGYIDTTGGGNQTVAAGLPYTVITSGTGLFSVVVVGA